MRQIKWIIDPGHGGMAFGRYMTSGKRSPHVPPGIYEGVFNRKVAVRIRDLVATYNFSKGRVMECELTRLGPINIPLTSRVDFVNSLPFRAHDMALISIHFNAEGGLKRGQWGKANGSRLFLSKRSSSGSKRLNKILSRRIDATSIPRRRTKSVNHTMTTRVKCPAILVETGFMTNKVEAQWLETYGALAWANIIFVAMLDYQEGLR